MAFVGELANALVKAVHLDLFPSEHADVFGMESSRKDPNTYVMGTGRPALKPKYTNCEEMKQVLVETRVQEILLRCVKVVVGRCCHL